VKHAIFMVGCLIALLFGCASKNTHQVQEPEWPEGSGAGPSSARQSGSTTANRSAAASSAAAQEAPAATGKMEVLGEMSDSTPGAANVTPPPCNLDTCAVVLGITTREVTESLAHDDGGPGVYVPEGMISMETAGQPAVWDAYGVEKLIQVWVITVQPRDGAVQVIQQRSAPGFSVGDSVLVNGNTILPWN
jgi:hypothetical protein